MTPEEQMHVLALERALFEAEVAAVKATELLDYYLPHSRAWQAREVLQGRWWTRGADSVRRRPV